MQSEKALGYAVFILGLAILLVTLYFGYGLYDSIKAQAASPQVAVSASQNNATVQAISSAVSEAIGQHLPSNQDFLYIIEIILLFLLANIGYKVAILGVHMNSSRRAEAAAAGAKNAKRQ
ncbi:MAG: hypothetical protein M1544_03920 [Candidatus Marsarchaeota archaeon]|nr:hypothetical protein [Candidatus Marsarchaeota archaeon]MCL5102475.1 hypothetical protein [Candidatus Marsarchaeota archaeon]